MGHATWIALFLLFFVQPVPPPSAADTGDAWVGKSRLEVVALLGEPGRTTRGQGRTGNQNLDESYRPRGHATGNQPRYGPAKRRDRRQPGRPDIPSRRHHAQPGRQAQARALTGKRSTHVNSYGQVAWTTCPPARR